MHAVPYILQLTDTFFLLWIFLTIQSYIGSWKLHVLAMWINNVKFPFSSQSNSVIYTVVFLSQIRTWMCSYLCSVRVKMIGDCLFCWYWWKCLPSLFRLSFHSSRRSAHVQNETYHSILQHNFQSKLLLEKQMLLEDRATPLHVVYQVS